MPKATETCRHPEDVPARFGRGKDFRRFHTALSCGAGLTDPIEAEEEQCLIIATTPSTTTSMRMSMDMDMSTGITMGMGIHMAWLTHRLPRRPVASGH